MADKVKGITIELGADTQKFQKGVKDASKEVESAGSKFADFAKGAGEAIAGAVAAAGAAVVAFGKTVADSVAATAEYGDNIDKMSQKLGISAEAYQEWEAIANHSGTSMESLKTSFKTLATQAQGNGEAFKALGMDMEEVQKMSTEDLFAATVEALQGMEEGTERTAIAAKLLGKGATELGPLLNTSAEDTEKMRQAVHDLGGVMSNDAVKAAARYQDSLQDMNTAMDGLKRNLSAQLLPAFADVMDGLTLIFSGQEGGIELVTQGIEGIGEKIEEMLPTLVQTVSSVIFKLAAVIAQSLPVIIETISTMTPMITDFITQIVDVVTENLPLIIDAGLQIIGAIVAGIVEAAPQLLDGVIEIIATIARFLAENVEDIIQAGITLVTELCNGLIEALPDLIDAGFTLLSGLIEGIVNNLDEIVEAVKQIIETFVNYITDNLPDILQQGIDLLMTLIDGILEALPDIITCVGEIIVTLIQAIIDNLPMIIEEGMELMDSLIDGILENLPIILPAIIKVIMAIVEAIIENLPKIIESGVEIIVKLIMGLIEAIPKIIEAIPTIIKAIVDAFGDYDWLEIGRNIMNGLKEGLLNAWETVKTAVTDVCDRIGDTFKGWFGIESPSKWMRDNIGKNMMAGLDVGMEKYSEDAIKEASRISGALQGAFAGTGGDLSALQMAQSRTANLTMTTPVYLDGRVIANVVNEQLGVLI